MSSNHTKKKAKKKAPPKPIKTQLTAHSAMSNRNHRTTKKSRRKVSKARRTNRDVVRALRRLILIDGIDITQLPNDTQEAGQDAAY